MPRLPQRLVSAALAALVAATPALAQQAASTQDRSIDRANLDTTCAPCSDFFQFANGGWLARTKIPPAYSSWGSFNELADRNQSVVHQLLEAAAADRGAAPGSNRQKVGTFYRVCMDSALADKEGLQPLEPALRRIAAIHDRTGLDRTLAAMYLEGQGGLFRLFAGPDPKNSSDVILSASQGGLGMPDRDYYTRTDARSAGLREAYQDHVQRMFQLLGESATQSQEDAQTVMRIETQLANASMTRVAQRDPHATYHKMALAEFEESMPNFDWTSYLDVLHTPRVTVVDVRQPAFFAALDGMLRNVPLEDWKTYLRWHAADAAAGALGSAFVDENFRWMQHLTGAREQLPRWKRCAMSTDRNLGEALGQEYVRVAFTPAAKARALAMVNNIHAALRQRIEGLTWMSPATRKQALIKLAAITRKIGYPDKWRDYSALRVTDDSYYGNLVRSAEFRAHDNLDQIGKPTDRTRWGMTPPTVNAYYNPTMNEIVFPAGILQPPFFDPNADDAVNYGAMGAVIGHETTHGFDDEGRKFDAQGNLRDWWTPEDATQYDERAQKVVQQFDAYTVVDSTTHVNGRLTLGENIADLGGLTIAYYALEHALAGKPRPLIDGFTPEQRFFLSWAQVWRSMQRPQAARAQVATNPHAPAKWRVDGPLSNMPEFRKAWGCKAGDPMVRPDSLRAQIW